LPLRASGSGPRQVRVADTTIPGRHLSWMVSRVERDRPQPAAYA